MIRTLSFLLIAFILLSFSSLAYAAAKVEITVRVIKAEKGEPKVDPRVSDVAKKLEGLFKFNRFELVKQSMENTDYTKAVSIALPQDKTLIVTPISVDAEKRIKIHIEMADLLKTDIRLKDGGSVYLGGPKIKTGVLVLVISARQVL